MLLMVLLLEQQQTLQRSVIKVLIPFYGSLPMRLGTAVVQRKRWLLQIQLRLLYLVWLMLVRFVRFV